MSLKFNQSSHQLYCSHSKKKEDSSNNHSANSSVLTWCAVYNPEASFKNLTLIKYSFKDRSKARLISAGSRGIACEELFLVSKVCFYATCRTAASFRLLLFESNFIWLFRVDAIWHPQRMDWKKHDYFTKIYYWCDKFAAFLLRKSIATLI